MSVNATISTLVRPFSNGISKLVVASKSKNVVMKRLVVCKIELMYGMRLLVHALKVQTQILCARSKRYARHTFTGPGVHASVLRR